MISIKYKVAITNPIKNNLKPTDKVDISSTLTFKRTAKGITIKGDYISKGHENSSGSFYGLGDKYTILNSSLVKNETTNIVDVLEVLKLDGVLYKDIPVTIASKIKKVTTIDDDLKMLEDIIESKNDIVLFELKKDGLLSRYNIDIKPFTNILETSNKNLLIYFIVNKTLNVDSINNEPFHLKTKDFKDLPNGFCSLKTSLSKRNDLVSQLNSYTYLLHSKYPQQYSCSLPVEVDGVLTSYFNTNKYDKTLITISDEYVKLNTVSLDLSGNITAIYLVSNKGELEPYLLYCDESTRLNFNLDTISSNFKIRSVTINSSEENKKRYLVKQYRIKVKSKNNTIELLDQNFYATLQDNVMQFNKKVIVND